MQIEESLVWLEIVSLSMVQKNFNNAFKDQGLVRSDHDHNMSYKIKNGNILILLLYVNDLLLTENLDEKVQLLKEQLLATFEMMDLGKVLFYIGIEFVYLLSCIFLTQRGYI